MPTDPPSPALLLAYATAVYEAVAQGRWAGCEAGLPGAAADAVLAVLSACNPGSRELPARENRRRHQQLCAQLRAAGIPHRAARGRAPDAGWMEASVLLCAPLEAIDALARAHGQLAVYLPGRPPRLRLYAPRPPGLPIVMANARLEWVGCDPPAALDPA